MGQFQYKYKQLDSFPRKLLICPKCYEALGPTDIENFPTCPYCDYSFELDGELEDFLLQPVIEHWMGETRYPLIQQ
ncbi:MAG: hypothetical protein A2X49_06800 [Lentisphaerae bacterium GWF2_52_8]|nr:MAG: hypothetical protein A2X49_06800 [Lentisphaerae bacterium GWF2_52_8]